VNKDEESFVVWSCEVSYHSNSRREGKSVFAKGLNTSSIM